MALPIASLFSQRRTGTVASPRDISRTPLLPTLRSLSARPICCAAIIRSGIADCAPSSSLFHK